MDRFKGFINVVVIQHIAIYIPVWIDLKDRWNRKNADIFNLYIPVWIDLKVEKTTVLMSQSILYIPVWIDLKVSECLYRFAPRNGFTFQYG